MLLKTNNLKFTISLKSLLILSVILFFAQVSTAQEIIEDEIGAKLVAVTAYALDILANPFSRYTINPSVAPAAGRGEIHLTYF